MVFGIGSGLRVPLAASRVKAVDGKLLRLE